MSTNDQKYIQQPQSSVQDTRNHNIEVMKPFFKFGLAAMGLIGGALIAIVKSIPKPDVLTDKNDQRITKR
jgi:hypothetical protein